MICVQLHTVLTVSEDVGLSRKHVLVGMKKSLKRLQMDYVDLVCTRQPHMPCCIS